MWYIYTMEYYSAIKNNEFMKFVGKCLELENIILSEVTNPFTKEHRWNAVTDKSPEAQNTQDTIHISNDSQEEGRRGPWSWKDLIQQG